VSNYTYFPGCSCASEGDAKAYGWSINAVSRYLGSEFHELKDWNCCGSTPSASVDELGSYCMAARDLALAEQMEFDLVTPCSACYVILGRTNAYLKKYPALKSNITEALSAGGLKYNGTVNVRHALDVLTNDIGFDVIASKVKKPLEGLKVAPYYGCQVVRPGFGFDHPENPKVMDKLIASLGADPVPFPLKTRCCGGSLIITEEELALGLLARLLESAISNGAQCLITACPLCQMNLDAYQGKVKKKFKTNYNLPILYFTQLMGIAFGLPGIDIGLKLGIINSEKVLANYL
jgi:heterodisulfide reductase subunit B